MKRFAFLCIYAFILSATVSSCYFEKIGPYEETTQNYGLKNFDRLEMGSGFEVKLVQGASFDVSVRGDKDDINDLDIYTRNGTLKAEYRRNRSNRRHEMHITVTMPTLRGVDFSGALQATAIGFDDLTTLDIRLSGASKVDFVGKANRLNVNLSGASTLDLEGKGAELRAELSGASTLRSTKYIVNAAELDLSGASSARVLVSDDLNVKASGASNVRYQGKPRINSQTSGNSTVNPE
ncbi:head GIN domain-containing protein [Tellurirhabdus bombi]|uniref:head GIN domain-containing protein n=1 Tax=Tellurirhabdus bombi TaxID=2907205 RepID=UPI001F44A5C1|nr:head GIN domain-containing protein [Tellurirhabdus bombi]